MFKSFSSSEKNIPVALHFQKKKNQKKRKIFNERSAEKEKDEIVHKR